MLKYIVTNLMCILAHASKWDTHEDISVNDIIGVLMPRRVHDQHCREAIASQCRKQFNFMASNICEARIFIISHIKHRV